MSERPTHAWCPNCQEVSAISYRGLCLWCDTDTKPQPPSRPKRWGRLSGELPELHRRHLAGESLGDLAREVWAQAGYASVDSARTSIAAAFRQRGWEVRSS